MGCLKLDNCCFCFSLRIGVLILGYLVVIASILGIIQNLNRSDAFYEVLRRQNYLSNVSFTPETDLIQNIITLLLFGLLVYGIHNVSKENI